MNHLFNPWQTSKAGCSVVYQQELLSLMSDSKLELKRGSPRFPARPNSLFRVWPFALQVYYASSSRARIRERGLKRWIRACILSARTRPIYSVKIIKMTNVQNNKKQYNKDKRARTKRRISACMVLARSYLINFVKMKNSNDKNTNKTNTCK